MTHPITPPPELVQQWIKAEDDPYEPNWQAYEEGIATRAAQWGADQELEACFDWLHARLGWSQADELRAARRPKPPSLKERALQAWTAVQTGTDDQVAMTVIRRALEALPDD